MAIAKTTIKERAWGTSFDVIDRVVTSINTGTSLPASTTTTAGVAKESTLVVVPGTFADLAAVRTWAAALTAALIAAGLMSAT